MIQLHLRNERSDPSRREGWSRLHTNPPVGDGRKPVGLYLRRVNFRYTDDEGNRGDVRQ